MSDIMDMTDLIVPKSDQLNADDLISGPITVRITKVSRTGAPEQPFAVSFDGDRGKPYKPCLSMRRAMVKVWGPDANAYVGRSMTLYRDDKVTFGGLETGGIRISHMTGIEAPVQMALMVKKGKRAPYVVQPLAATSSQEPRKKTRAEWLDMLASSLDAAKTAEDVDAIVTKPNVIKATAEFKDADLARLNAMIAAALARVGTSGTKPPTDDATLPGDDAA